MTTIVILFLGLGAVLIISAVESNPDGSDVSVIQAVKDIWNDNLNFQQGNTPAKGAGPADSGTGPGVGSYVPPHAQVVRAPDTNTVAQFNAQYRQNGRRLI